MENNNQLIRLNINNIENDLINHFTICNIENKKYIEETFNNFLKESNSIFYFKNELKHDDNINLFTENDYCVNKSIKNILQYNCLKHINYSKPFNLDSYCIFFFKFENENDLNGFISKIEKELDEKNLEDLLIFTSFEINLSIMNNTTHNTTNNITDNSKIEINQNGFSNSVNYKSNIKNEKSLLKKLFNILSKMFQ